jgi:predicted flavoprotein YhiN
MMSYDMKGKTTFKEEFVTAGGINLKEVNFKTMESKLVPHLFFCGEVLNIDGITGGFNFQNAWSTAYGLLQRMCLTKPNSFYWSYLV